MKNRLILILLGGIVVATLLVGAISAERQHRERIRFVKALQSLSRDRVDAAVQAFIRDKKTGGASLPATVTFGELVSSGYLTKNDVAAFDGKEVMVSLSDDITPQSILIRVPLTNGREIVEMGDGSVQMIPSNP
jgi:hypothetical protein